MTFTATTDGLMLFPSGGFLNVMREPIGVVKSKLLSAAAILSRSASPAFFMASAIVSTLSYPKVENDVASC